MKMVSEGNPFFGSIEASIEIFSNASFMFQKQKVKFVSLSESMQRKTALYKVIQTVFHLRGWGPHSTVDSILASHPAAPGSILGVSDVFQRKLFSEITSLTS